MDSLFNNMIATIGLILMVCGLMARREYENTYQLAKKYSSVNRHSQNGESDNELNRFPEKKLKTCP